MLGRIQDFVKGGGGGHLSTPDKIHGFCLLLLSSKQPMEGEGVAIPYPPTPPIRKCIAHIYWG